MDKLEYKSIPLSLTDLDREHRVAVIAHATYDSIDRLNDISRPGMFNKSWNEHKGDVEFLVNHDRKMTPGVARDCFEDKAHGYTKVEFGKHTLGNDYLEMVDQGIVRDASFGFKAMKFAYLEVKGKKIRELKEVYHGETSLIHGMMPIHPESGVVLVKKATDPMLFELKARLEKLEKFCRNTTASDECIQKVLLEVKAIYNLISQDDTADTHDGEPDASDSDEMNEDDQSSILTQIKLIHAKTVLS